MASVGGRVLVAAVVGLGSAFACSPSAGTTHGSRQSGKEAPPPEPGSDASTPGTPGGERDGGSFVGFVTGDSGPAGDGALTADAACAATVMQPEAVKVDKTVTTNISCTADVPQPIALYIVLDNSGSMSDNNKWTDSVSALTQFVQSDPTAQGSAWTCTGEDGGVVPPPADLPPPGSGSISVAIQYFHPENAGSNPNECDGSAHATPAVPMGTIPANGGAIVNSLNGTGPRGNTPTVGALTGGVNYCAVYQANNPATKCVVVLVTDGQPNGCGLSSSCGGFGGGSECVDPNAANVLTPIAANAFNHPGNSVMTFTLGMNGVTPDGFNLLNQIAIAGGTDCTPNVPGNEACDISTSGAQGFLDALNRIRSTVQVSKNSTHDVTQTTTQHTTLECEWAVPKPTPPQTFDKDRVNVTVSAGGTSQRIGNVPTQADCAAAGQGWYYDDPANPTKILVCPDTCTTIQSNTDARVEVLVGCVTQPAIVQ